jgi:6-pyruvoyl-tetrahydropterin synthase
MADLSNASNDLFFKLRNRFPKIRLGDENGVTTIDPEAARFFNFRYVDKQSERDYGEITCSLIDGNSMKVFFDTAITERMLPEDKDYWYRFLRELRRYAKSHMLNFDVRDISKDVLSRRDYEFLAKNNPEKKKMKESLEESRVLWQRRGKVSEGNLNNVRIHVVHNERMLENPNNRLLKVDRIFLVNESGEKFLLPFKSVSGAKAMANHVSRGGNPYDSNGQIISRAVNEMRNLGRFASVTRTRTFEATEANNVIRAAQTVKENLKRHLNRLSNNSRSFNESLEALAEFLGEQVEDVTEVKAWFTQQTYNENLDNYLASAAGAYKKLRENTLNKLDEVSDSVKNKILDKNFKLVLKADAGLDKLMTSRDYTDTKAMAVAILGDIANRLIAPNGDDVANFAALMGDLMSSEGEAFGQKSDDKEYSSDKKLAILLAQKYLKELNLIKQKPELESQYRKDMNRKPEKIKGKKTESEVFAEEIMSIGEEGMGASVEDITDAISNRLLHSNLAAKMLRAHGLDKVLDAIHDVAQDHVGVEEIGTSDVSAMVNQVMQSLGMREDEVEESGLQYYTGKKKYGKDGMAALAKAGREGASQEELGRIKDKYMKKENIDEAELSRGGKLGLIALATGLGITGGGILNNLSQMAAGGMGDIVPYMYKKDPKGGYEIVLKRNPSREIGHADSEEAAKEWIRAKIQSNLKKEDAVTEEPNEGNEFSGELASGKKEFEVDGKTYPVKEDSMSIQQLAQISDKALDDAYHYGRSQPSNTFGWQANLKSAEFAKRMIDSGVTDIEKISDAIHNGWNMTAKQFVTNPDQFSDTAALKANGKFEAKLAQRQKLMNIAYAQLPDDEKEKDRVVARALLQAIKSGAAPKQESVNKKETPMKNKKIEEMRRLAGLPLVENYIYAQEEDDDNTQHNGEPSPQDKAEYDQEGRMSKNRLATIVDAAEELEKMLQDNENLPEWVQDKITMAADYIDTVRDYMKSNDVEYTDENVEEAAKPDFLDLDKDGDKEEPMKQAAKQAKEKKEKTEESVKADLRWMQAVAGIVMK